MRDAWTIQARMLKVQDYMNSGEFGKDGDSGSLMRLCQSLRTRCEDVIDLKGERLPT